MSSSSTPTTAHTTSNKTPSLEKIDELSVADLSIKEEGDNNESDKKANAQNVLAAAREQFMEKVNSAKKSAILSPVGLPMKAGTSFKPAGTKLTGRDGASTISAGTKLGGRDYTSMAPAGTRLNDRDSEPLNFKSMKPQGTLLLNRDHFASMAPGTRLTERDIQSVLPDQEAIDKFTEITGIPKAFAPSSSFLPPNLIAPSALRTSNDAVKAVQQIYFTELADEDKAEQLQWVDNILKNLDPCPQDKKVSSLPP